MTGELEVRRATADDARGIVDVLVSVGEERVYILTEPGVDVEVRTRALVEALESGDDVHWVLLDGERIVGSLGLHGGLSTGVAELGTAIVSTHRGRGGGRLLLDAALDHARSGDLHKVTLTVYTDNARAIALYARAGFVVEGLLRRHYKRSDGTLRDALLMALHVGES